MADLPYIQPPLAQLVGDGNYAVLGVPEEAAKIGPVPEIYPHKLARLIEVRGVRLAWSRAAECPCQASPDTDQPDPRHTRCKGQGWYYFRPDDYSPPEQAGALTDIQEALLTRDNAAIIRGVVSGVANHQSAFTHMGEWQRGVMYVTVRAENKVGYRDILTNLDALIAFSEVIDLDDPTDPRVALDPMPLRYRAQQITKVITPDADLVYGLDYTRSDDGRLVWVNRPVGRVGIHYLTHPTWRVVSHPHALRGTTTGRKQLDPVAPIGNPVDLPIQAEVMLDFLPDEQALETRPLGPP